MPALDAARRQRTTACDFTQAEADHVAVADALRRRRRVPRRPSPASTRRRRPGAGARRAGAAGRPSRRRRRRTPPVTEADDRAHLRADARRSAGSASRACCSSRSPARWPASLMRWCDPSSAGAVAAGRDRSAGRKAPASGEDGADERAPQTDGPDRPAHRRVDASPPPAGRRRRSRPDRRLAGAAARCRCCSPGSLLYLFVLSGLEQGHAQSALYERLRTELAEGTAPTGAPIAAGSPVALLSIPDAGVDGPRSSSRAAGPAQLQDGPGHVLGSVLPGQQRRQRDRRPLAELRRRRSRGSPDLPVRRADHGHHRRRASSSTR